VINHDIFTLQLWKQNLKRKKMRFSFLHSYRKYISPPLREFPIGSESTET